jgi:ribosomal protein S18 acetylase RimI-like enzyme
MVPRLWLQHFAATSTVVHSGDALVGFLIGFLSLDIADESYIHFVGVAPDHRGRGLGRQLYERFFAHCRTAGRTRVRCLTGPVNALSIAFHQAMGFTVEPAKPDYDGPGLARVTFVRAL